MSDSLAHKVLILIPAFNEADSITKTIQEVKVSCPNYSIMVISDGSTDDTVRLASGLGVKVLRLSLNLGVGGAMRAGFKYAYENGFDAAVQVDADGQHDPKNVTRLLRGLSKSDIVIGSRFLNDDTYEVRGPRKLAMRLLSRWMSLIVHQSLTDTTSGFKAHNRRAIELFQREYPAEYLGDTLEAIVIAHRARLRIIEEPVTMRPREAGQASHGPVRSSIFLARAAVAILFALTQRDHTKTRK